MRYPENVGFEIWNEPNLPAYWEGNNLDGDPNNYFPAEYAAVVHEGAAGIKAANPTLTTFAGGVSPAAGWQSYLSGFYSQYGGTIKDSFEILSVHPYPKPGDSRGDLASILARYDSAIAKKNEAGDTSAAFVTEVGISTYPQYGPREVYQGDVLVAAENQLINRGSAGVIIHRLYDSNFSDLDTGYGTMRVPPAKRDAVDTPQNAQPKYAFCKLAVEHGQPPC